MLLNIQTDSFIRSATKSRDQQQMNEYLSISFDQQEKSFSKMPEIFLVKYSHNSICFLFVHFLDLEMSKFCATDLGEFI